MKSQTLVLLIIAGACGLVAMLGVKQYLAKQNQREVIPTKEVLVATSVIKQGDRLTELNTAFKTLEVGSFPEGVVTELAQIEERALKVSRGIGDWIMVDQLTEKGAVGATAVIPRGMRVTTIPVDATTHHSGMLQPGNRIDLFLTFQDRDRDTGQMTDKIRPILEYIEVFAVDNMKYGLNEGGENMQARNISLLVTPEQLMKLQLAKKKGSLSTSLRSSEDKESISIAEMTDEALDSTRSQIDETSVLDGPEEEGGFALPEDEDMQSLLRTAMNDGKTGPVGQPAEEQTEDSWVMAIYESNGIRVENVSLDSTVPIDTRGTYGGGGGLDPSAFAGPKTPGAGPAMGDPGASGGIPGLDSLLNEGGDPQDLLEDLGGDLMDSLF